MSKLIPGNHKHLTLEDRTFIEESLDEGKSFRAISKYLCKNPSSISDEVHKTGSPILGTEEVLIIPITFVFTGSAVRR